MTIFCLGFQALLTDETISNVPILILGNKIDRPEAISEDALRGTFGLHGHTTGKVKKKKPNTSYDTDISVNWRVFCITYNVFFILQKI